MIRLKLHFIFCVCNLHRLKPQNMSMKEIILDEQTHGTFWSQVQCIFYPIATL